jgi:hypothetical protein
LLPNFSSLYSFQRRIWQRQSNLVLV